MSKPPKVVKDRTKTTFRQNNIKDFYSVSKTNKKDKTYKKESVKKEEEQNIYKKDFTLYGSWEALDARKILPRGPTIISTPGKPNSDKKNTCLFDEGVSIEFDVIIDIWGAETPIIDSGL